MYLLRKCDILTNPQEAERLFNPKDLVDIADMVKCLDYVSKLSDVHWHAFSQVGRTVASNRTKYQAFKVLGHVARLMCLLIIGHEGGAEEDSHHLSVSEYLEQCSRLSHMLFFLFRCNKTGFRAAQNYRNWQDTVKNMFVTVALAKEHGIKDFYCSLNTNKQLKQLFGIVRSMMRGHLNFNCLDLCDCIGDAVLIQWIYSEHPEWDRTDRRVPNTVDRTNTHWWRGDTNTIAGISGQSRDTCRARRLIYKGKPHDN